MSTVAPPSGTLAVTVVSSVSEPTVTSSSPAKRGDTFSLATSPGAYVALSSATSSPSGVSVDVAATYQPASNS